MWRGVTLYSAPGMLESSACTHSLLHRRTPRSGKEGNWIPPSRQAWKAGREFVQWSEGREQKAVGSDLLKVKLVERVERESRYYEWTTPIFDGLEPVLAIMAVELAWHVDGIEAALAFVDSDVMAPLSLGIGRRIAAFKREPGPGIVLSIGPVPVGVIR